MVQNEILLINDGSFLLRMMGRRLDKKGYQAWVTEEPEQALEILSNYDFGLVVIKLSEEDIERLAVLQMIKDLCPETKLVIISDSEFLPIEVFEADFDDYISVPCSPAKLWRRLSIYLEEHVDQQKNLFLHPANYRIVHRLVANLQEIYQNLRDGEEGLKMLQEQVAYQEAQDLAANLVEDAHQKHSQSISLVEKMLNNFTGHDFFQDQVDCYDI